jgi:cyanophycinase
MHRGRPKGYLVAIGGNEDKQFAKDILRRVVDLPEGGSRRVALIPTASSIPAEVTDDYRQAFGKLGIEQVDVLDIQRRSEAEDREHAQSVRDCDVVYFTGGDQLRLTSLVGGTRLEEAIREHYWNGGVVAGTSAGAAAMSATMIMQGEPSQGMRKGSVSMSPGFALLPKCVLDTHFLDRGRLSRLLEVVTTNPGHIGIGVGEDTGIIVRDGVELEVIGSGVVVIVDGSDLRHTNVSDIQHTEAIAAEHLIVNTLPARYRYDLAERRYIPAPREPPKEAPIPNEDRSDQERH